MYIEDGEINAIIEYANLNSQLSYTSELTLEGFRQGSLGEGVSNWKSSEWSEFNKYNPFVPCGHTDTLGNGTGVIAYTAYKEDGSEFKNSDVPRYRGVENPFGHIWKCIDGCKCLLQSGKSGGLSEFYVCDEPANFTNSGVANYQLRGVLPRIQGYVKALILGEDGEIMPLEVGASSTTYFCDYFYTNIPLDGVNENNVLLGGTSYPDAYAGFTAVHTALSENGFGGDIGSRLCFIPQQNKI